MPQTPLLAGKSYNTCALASALITSPAVIPVQRPCAAVLTFCSCLADTRSGAAKAARLWLRRNAAGVKRLCNESYSAASACTSLVSCLPALESADLHPCEPGDLGRLLKALARCPRLTALGLTLTDSFLYHDDGLGLAAIANLRSLTSLTWTYESYDNNLWYERDPCLADLVVALAPLTGLTDLSVDFFHLPIIVPSDLANLTGLRSLAICTQYFQACACEPWCLRLPELLTLTFITCDFHDPDMLPSFSALPSLTRIEFSGCKGRPDCEQHVLAQLVHLPRLQHCVLEARHCALACAWFVPELLRLPLDVGSLSSTLLRLDVSELALPLFPLVLTQLVALERLEAGGNGCAEVPAGITALSRLTELTLGRYGGYDTMYEMPLLNVVALGDLSAFPALRKLTFAWCKVRLCPSMPSSAMRLASLNSIVFELAYPAPECMQMVLQLSRELRRSSVSVLADGNEFETRRERARMLGLRPFSKFKAALELCAL